MQDDNTLFLKEILRLREEVNALKEALPPNPFAATSSGNVLPGISSEKTPPAEVSSAAPVGAHLLPNVENAAPPVPHDIAPGTSAPPASPHEYDHVSSAAPMARHYSLQNEASETEKSKTLLPEEAMRLQQLHNAYNEIIATLKEYATVYPDALLDLQAQIHHHHKKTTAKHLAAIVSPNAVYKILDSGPLHLSNWKTNEMTAKILIYFCTNQHKDYAVLQPLLSTKDNRKIFRSINALQRYKLLHRINLNNYEVTDFGLEILRKAVEKGG